MKNTLKKIITALLSALMLSNSGDSLSWIKNLTSSLSSQTEEESDTFTVPDKSETDLYRTVEYAYSQANQVDCIYSDGNRSTYIMSNADITLTHTLSGEKKMSTLTNKKGKAYLKDTFLSYYTDKSGKKHYFEDTTNKGRVNTVRLGEYYYECNVRDLACAPFYVDKTFHVYGDRLYMQYSLLTVVDIPAPSAFGSEIEISASKVRAVSIKDKNGIHRTCVNIDTESVEYAAFDIIGVGVVGFIVPDDGTTQGLTVKRQLTKYTVTLNANLKNVTGINSFDEEGPYDTYKVTFGCRIYTDSTHSFKGVQNASYIEHNPLTLTVTDTDANAKAIGYNPLRGTYDVTIDGTGFQAAYDNPDRKYSVSLKAEGDDTDRAIYVRTSTPDSAGGCLESAVLLDDNSLLMPVDVQVCKNFRGDYGDRYYSYVDYAYGDAFVPIYVEKNGTKSFTVVNLYQNWGNYPLKQLSSIEFHTSYYHMSTGTTESNCFAPYFVYGRDGWVLPDFRTSSGNMWSEQPQYNSVGILKFMTYNDPSLKKTQYAEYAGSEIKSCGPTYVDFVTDYKSDTGAFTYSLEHIEFPQTDENRTYYNINVTFTDTITFTDFRNNFDLFYFDGRFATFGKCGYLDGNNKSVISDVSGSETVHTLGDDAPYISFFEVSNKTEDNFYCRCSFGLIIRDSEIIMSGVEQNIPFAFREYGVTGYTTGCLTLDAEELTFNAGDTIKLQLILLPYGTGDETDLSTVIKVREDSVINPLSVVGSAGTDYIPHVKATDNKAEFTIKGGRGNNIVVIDGFTSMKKPTLMQYTGGEWKEVALSSSCGYDGYMFRPQSDGTFSLSFVYTADSPDTEYSFKIEN